MRGWCLIVGWGGGGQGLNYFTHIAAHLSLRFMHTSQTIFHSCHIGINFWGLQQNWGPWKGPKFGGVDNSLYSMMIKNLHVFPNWKASFPQQPCWLALHHFMFNIEWSWSYITWIHIVSSLRWPWRATILSGCKLTQVQQKIWEQHWFKLVLLKEERSCPIFFCFVSF